MHDVVRTRSCLGKFSMRALIRMQMPVRYLNRQALSADRLESTTIGGLFLWKGSLIASPVCSKPTLSISRACDIYMVRLMSEVVNEETY